MSSKNSFPNKKNADSKSTDAKSKEAPTVAKPAMDSNKSKDAHSSKA